MKCITVTGVSSMWDDGLRALLDECDLVDCATNGPNGWPHCVPIAYVTEGNSIWSWTLRRSQKVRNLRRDPRATLALRAGETVADYRGAMLRTRVAIHDEPTVVERAAFAVVGRKEGGMTTALEEIIRAEIPRRLALEFTIESHVRWDHREHSL
jgi:hypothetical protein